MEKEAHAHARPYHVKEGIKSTEFYLALGVLVIATAIVGVHMKFGGYDVASAVSIGAAAITSIGYSRARAHTKTSH